jgi:protein SCO1/2
MLPKKVTTLIDSLNLIDHKGYPFKANSLKQQPSLIFFGFTHCPEVCPTTLGELSEITGDLKNKIIPTNIVFVTLDPERDNQKDLNQYLNNFDENIIGVTGSIKDLKKLGDNWGVYYKRVSLKNNDYTLNHTATVFMIDKDGNYRGTIAWGENEDSMAQKITKLSTY